MTLFLGQKTRDEIIALCEHRCGCDMFRFFRDNITFRVGVIEIITRSIYYRGLLIQNFKWEKSEAETVTMQT